MAFRKHTDALAPASPCHPCVSKDPLWRHKHWAQYDGDLAQHLRESLPLLLDGTPDDGRIGHILQWVHSLRSHYGGVVDEHGAYMSAWEARRAVQNQYEKTYACPPAPRSGTGRQITFRAFLALLTSTQSPHATGWRDMLTTQFTAADMGDEGKWSDLTRFMREYTRSSTAPDHAEFLERVDVRPVVKLAGGVR